MAKTGKGKPVDTTETSEAPAATAAAPDAVETPAEASTASDIIAGAYHASEEVLAVVREDLSRAEQVVMEWVGDHFANSPISRATEALNYLREHAVPDLLNRIKEI
jgi:hypothetical protein